MTTTEKQTTSALQMVFDTCRDYPSTGYGLSTSSDQSKAASEALITIGNYFSERLSIPEDWHFKVSKGAGAFPMIPWILFCPKTLKAPKEGIYVCITFSKNGKGAVAGKIVATAEKSKYRDQITKVPDEWNLSINGVKPNTKYKDAFINPKPFYADAEPDELLQELYAHLKNSIDSLPPQPTNKLLVKDFQTPESLNPSLIKSLLTKHFVILTGNSGTGKTHLAETLAATYRNHEQIEEATNVATVPVGADWTDSRAVVGFVNHLRAARIEKTDKDQPVYQSTAVVDLLLAADSKHECPHFLILDEMNLSHVERYFADFLSAMESGTGRIRFHDEGPRDEDHFRLPRFQGDPFGVPRSIAYPHNLFVIGTVNIDETTYMFSPKVLDRAHVIEFVVDRDDIAAFLEKPEKPERPPKASGTDAHRFLELSQKAKTGQLEPLPGAVSEAVNKHLMNCLDLLQMGRFEFAYRTANEILQYMHVCHHLAKDKKTWAQDVRLTRDEIKSGQSNWRSDLDDEILQKVLPRLHGSRNRIGPLIGALTYYMHTPNVETAKTYFPEGSSEIAEKSISDTDFAELKVDGAHFPRSFHKLRAMAQILAEEQFVSFIC